MRKREQDRTTAWNMKRKKCKWKQGRAAGITMRKKSSSRGNKISKGEQEDRTVAWAIRKKKSNGEQGRAAGNTKRN